LQYGRQHMAYRAFAIGAANMNCFEFGVRISKAFAKNADVSEVFPKRSTAHAAKHGQLVI
jgi:hypothetical protein